MATQSPRTDGTIRPLDATGAGVLLACCLIWGVNQVALKVANEGIPPLFQATLRGVLCAVLIGGWMAARRMPLVARDGALLPGIATGITFAANIAFIGLGLALTEASRGVLFLYTAPIFVAIGAHFLIPGDRLTSSKVAGLVLAFLGLALSFSEKLGAPGARASLLGDVLCMFAGASWAATTLIQRTTRLRFVSPERTLLYQLIVSMPLLLAGSYLLGEPPVGPLTPAVLGWFAYTVVVVVFLSYLLWLWLLSRYVASQVSVFTFLAPMFAVAAGHLLLGEPITAHLGIALALVAGGIYLVNRPRH